MSKTTLSVLAVVVLVVGGYFIFKNKGVDNNGVQNPALDENGTSAPLEGLNPNAESGKKMAFSEFIKQGGSYKCTVNQNVNNTVTQGTTYIDGSLIRGEYNTQVQGMNMDSTLIVRDGYTYSWTSMMPTMGFKAKVVANASGDASAGTSGTYSFHAEQIGDYNCEAWTADSTKFTLPTNITFKEVGA